MSVSALCTCTLVVFLFLGAFEGSNGECMDLNQYCSRYHSYGYCSTHPDWMKTNCPKSCNFCSGGSGGSSGSGGSGSGSFAQDGLQAHNKYRRIHNAPDMTLNSELSRQAASYAAEIASRGSLVHSSSSDGENLAMMCGKDLTAAAATKMWYNEVCYYDFNYGGFSGRTGHFTQVVWKGSTELGMGKATSGRCTYVVGRYRRAGNYGGQFQENVVKGSFNRGSTCQ